MAEYAKRFPTDTPIEVFNTAHPPTNALLLDQTTPQHVINGAPYFDLGLNVWDIYSLADTVSSLGTTSYRWFSINLAQDDNPDYGYGHGYISYTRIANTYETRLQALGSTSLLSKLWLPDVATDISGATEAKLLLSNLQDVAKLSSINITRGKYPTGSDLVTNGDFSGATSTPWVLQAGLQYIQSSGIVNSGSATTYCTQEIGTLAGHTYIITYYVAGMTAGDASSITPKIGAVAGATASNGLNIAFITCAVASDDLRFDWVCNTDTIRLYSVTVYDTTATSCYDATGGAWDLGASDLTCGTLHYTTLDPAVGGGTPEAGTVTYSGNQITSIEKGATTYTYTYTGNKITSITDGSTTWTISYTGNKITGWTI